MAYRFGMDLDRLDSVTLITGAASGIGAACARDLARVSPGGLILVDQDEAGLDSTADKLDQPPERVSTLAFDVADPDRWAQAASFVQAQYGKLDWAIVNATAAPTDLIDWERKIAAGLEGVVQSMRALMPLMGASVGGGAIVIIAPAVTLDSRAGVTAGLLQVVRAAAKEGAHQNIRVNAIAPGGAETSMWSTLPWFQDLVREMGDDRAALNAVAKMATPMARYASAVDVTRLIIMLLSDASPITGATLVVDGGYTI